MIHVNSGASSIWLNPKKRIVVSDYQIIQMIGVNTYVMLYLHSKHLYREIPECSQLERRKASRSGQKPGMTDFLDLFIDGTYTSKNLKEDLVRIIVGEKPKNVRILGFVNSSNNPTILQQTSSSWFVTLILIILFWVTIVLAVYSIYNHRLYTLKCD